MRPAWNLQISAPMGEFYFDSLNKNYPVASDCVDIKKILDYLVILEITVNKIFFSGKTSILHQNYSSYN